LKLLALVLAMAQQLQPQLSKHVYVLATQVALLVTSVLLVTSGQVVALQFQQARVSNSLNSVLNQIRRASLIGAFFMADK
jgi:hypothetical protein